MEEINSSMMSAAALAYLGDCVYELHVRELLVRRFSKKPSVDSLKYVTAGAQSKAIEKILPILNEAENDAYHRGRNCVHNSAPKHSTMAEYRRATGFEAVFGFVHMFETMEREKELFELAVQAIEE